MTVRLFRASLPSALLLAITAVPAAASDEEWPHYVPKGWKLIGSVADRDDAVLMIEQDDPAKRIANEGLGERELNTNPRHLMFLSRLKAGYRVAGAADRFLPSEGDAESPCLADPLEEGGMELRNGVLTISLNYWSSCGSWSTSRSSFKFRLENGRYRLIGFDRLSYARNGGTGDEISVNYLTGRKKLTSDIEIFEPEAGTKSPKPKVRWSSVGRQKYYLDTMDKTQCEGDENAPNWCGN